MLTPSSKIKRTRLFLLSITDIQSIKQEYNSPAVIKTKNGSFNATCLRCSVPYCIKHTEEELSHSIFNNFEDDKNNDVCPVNAIKWDYKNEYPKIEPKLCINCGLCAVRCPIGAIYNKSNSMHISTDNEHFKNDVAYNDRNVLFQSKQLRSIEKIDWEHKFVKENKEILQNLYNRLKQIQHPNRFIRNIFLQLGYYSSASRQGNPHSRIDVLYQDRGQGKPHTGVVEVEFGEDSLDALRSLLDDIVTADYRNGLKINNDDAVLVLLSLPKKRQGSLQVLKDIKNVLNIKIQTISVGALLLLIWNGKTIDFSKGNLYIDFDNPSIRDYVSSVLNRNVYVDAKFLGILTPEK